MPTKIFTNEYDKYSLVGMNPEQVFTPNSNRDWCIYGYYTTHTAWYHTNYIY